MIHLPVDVNSSEWQHVQRWAQARIAEHTHVCTSLSAGDRDRLIAAARIEELKVLLVAPGDTQRLTAQRVDTPVQPTY